MAVLHDNCSNETRTRFARSSKREYLFFALCYLISSAAYGFRFSTRPRKVSLKASTDDMRLEKYLQQSQERELHRFSEFDAPKWLQNQSSMPFECTSCGKCCRTVGDVYLSPKETTEAADLLKISTYEFIKTYCSHTLRMPKDPKNTWVKLKDKTSEKGEENAAGSSPACVFLDSETNFCKIYEARPTQCRTYPFWPSLLSSPEAWDAECRRTDDDTGSALPPWTEAVGGCEGMRPIKAQNNPKSNKEGGSTVSMKDAYRQLQSYSQQLRAFPLDDEEIPVGQDGGF